MSKFKSNQFHKLSSGQLLKDRGIDPITPMENKLYTKDPDSAKMAGTPAQKKSAFKKAAEGSQETSDLSTVLRRQQSRTDATGQEISMQERAEKSGQLNSLESRVDKLAVDAIAESAAAAPIEAQLVAAEGQDETLTTLLGQLSNSPHDQNLILQINQALGITDPKLALDGPSLLAKYSGDLNAQSLANALTQTIGEHGLDVKKLGFEDMDELSEFIGTDSESLSNMSIQELVETVDNMIKDEYAQTEELQNKASDVNLGTAERAEARKNLRDLGSVGVRATEQELDDMMVEIDNAQKINFLGEETNISELLNSDFVSGIILNYLTDPAEAEKINEQEPEMAEFIEKHKAALETLTENIEEGAGEFAATQAYNQNLNKTGLGLDTDLSEEVMEVWLPTWDKISATKYELPTPLYIFQSKDYTDAQKTSFKEFIDQVEKTGDKKLLQDIAKMSALELDALGALDSSGIQSEGFKKLISNLTIHQEWKNVNTLNDVALKMGADSYKEVRNTDKEAQTRLNSGFFDTSEDINKVRGLSETINKGRDFKEASKNMKNTSSIISLNDLSKPVKDYTGDYAATKRFNNQSNENFNFTKSAFENDDKISDDELHDIINRLPSKEDDILKLALDDNVISKGTASTMDILFNAYKETQELRIYDDFNRLNSGGGKGGFRIEGRQQFMDLLHTDNPIYTSFIQSSAPRVLGMLKSKAQLAEDSGNPLLARTYREMHTEFAQAKRNQEDRKKAAREVAKQKSQTESSKATESIGSRKNSGPAIGNYLQNVQKMLRKIR